MKYKTILIYPCLFLSSIGWVNAESIADKQLIHQQERQKAIEESLTPTPPDVRLQSAIPKKPGKQLEFPKESVCFTINQVNLRNEAEFPRWLALSKMAKQAEGHCLGGQGINLIMRQLQNKLIGHGYITSRVVAAPQDLKQGKLDLVLVPGKTRHLRYTDDSQTYAQLFTAMPVREGKLLDLRDIEQGLENLQRLPTVSAQMELVPGDEAGESDIQIRRYQSRFWRLGLSLDDSGTRTTGRYQGSVTFSLDNPLSLSDLFYVTAGRDIPNRGYAGTHNYMLHYSVPFGYWLFSTSYNKSHYLQTVQGAYQQMAYSGDSKNLNLQLSRVLYRDETAKTTLSYGITLRDSHNYMNDEEIDIQRRKTTNWQMSLQHRQNIGQSTLNLGLTYQQGTRWFHALPAMEEEVDDGTALAKIVRYNVSLNAPFTIGKQRFRYNFDLQGQQTGKTLLTPQDRFSIGGRWSVRGFDGELSLSADRGFYIRNELSWAALDNHELYLGLDYGHVFGPAPVYLMGRSLTGGAVGMRGNLPGGFYYDMFAGVPIDKPDHFKTDPVALGFSLNWNY